MNGISTTPMTRGRVGWVRCRRCTPRTPRGRRRTSKPSPPSPPVAPPMAHTSKRCDDNVYAQPRKATAEARLATSGREGPSTRRASRRARSERFEEEAYERSRLDGERVNRSLRLRESRAAAAAALLGVGVCGDCSVKEEVPAGAVRWAVAGRAGVERCRREGGPSG